MLMSYAVKRWQMFVIISLHGGGFQLICNGIIEKVYKISSKEISLPMVTFMSNLHNNAAAAIANVIGGAVYYYYGGRVLFRWSGIVCGVWGVLMTLYFGIKHIRLKRALEKNNSLSQQKSETETCA